MTRTRRVSRLSEPESLPRVWVGRGYGDPPARAAYLVELLARPAMAGAATLAGRFPNRAAMARAKPVRLNTPDGRRILLTGERLDSGVLA